MPVCWRPLSRAAQAARGARRLAWSPPPPRPLRGNVPMRYITAEKLLILPWFLDPLTEHDQLTRPTPGHLYVASPGSV